LTDALPANQIDNLYYSYKPNSNILTSVNDNSGNTSGFKDGTNTDDDYTYDDNGNLTTDKNKAIVNILYNYLNLPIEITFGGQSSDYIRYIYDALGVKQKKIVWKNTDLTETCYAGNFQYVQYFEGGLPSVLKFFSQPEGYVEPSGSSFKYVYQYKDHLGNIRLSYKDANNNGSIENNEIIEENNYYPFGLKHQGYNTSNAFSNFAYNYKYNGKELQDELGLNMYDYGARNYDPALGRWMNIDPLAETSRRFSPYAYALNNPVFFIDPDGMEAKGADGLTMSEWANKNRRNMDKMAGGDGIDIKSMTYSTEDERAQNEKEKGKSTATAGDVEMIDDASFDDEKVQIKSMEAMLNKKLQGMKLNSTMKGNELDFLDKNASYGIKTITRVSKTRFNITPTTVGSWKGIKENAYITIEPNKTITGKYFDQGVKSITGYRVTQYNTPPMEIGNSKTNTYIINGNNAYYQKTTKTISSWDLTE
jgi:RHS repeat-associated protein